MPVPETAKSGANFSVQAPSPTHGDTSAEMQLLRTESEVQKFRLEDLGRRLASVSSALESVQAEVVILKARKALNEQVAHSVRTVREDLNRVLETQSTAAALPAMPVSVEEVLTRVNPRLERLEDAVAQSVANDGKQEVMEIHSRKAKTKRQKKSLSKKRSRDRDSENSESVSSDSSGDSDSDSTDSDDSSSSEEDRLSKNRRRRSARKKKGPRYPGLKPPPCTNPLYRKLMNYRMYRLKIRKTKRTGHETAKVKDHIKRLKVGMDNLTFDGKDPIMIFDFLSRFVSEANTLEMSEPQAFVAIPHFLSGFALDQYRAVSGSLTVDEGG